MQEIFLEIWKYAGRFDVMRSSEIGFIALLARRKLIDGYRKLKSKPDFEDSQTVFDNLTGQNEKAMYVRLDFKCALKTLNKLPPEQKNLILLSYFEGLSHTDIAERVGKPLGTVKSTIRRGLQIIRQDLRFGII